MRTAAGTGKVLLKGRADGRGVVCRLVLLTLAAVVGAQDVVELEVEPVLRLGVEGSGGWAYALESHGEACGWSVLGVRQFSAGGELWWTVPVAGERGIFRVRENRKPGAGPAPDSLVGARLRINSRALSGVLEGWADGIVDFVTGQGESRGTLGWVRTGEDCGVATLQWPGGGKDVLRMTYAGPACGRVVVERYDAAGRFAGAAAGTFGDAGEETSVQAPVSVGGLSAVMAGAGRARLIFLDGKGLAIEGGEVSNWTYRVVSPGVSSVVMRRSGGESEEITWTFTGPWCGQFVSRELRHGVKVSERQGRFSLTGG
ncbi:MAG: hypothetical protein RLZZ179_2295 [Verrucomicrobiota bacterium]|jgi:hypothetical protein